MLVDGDRYSEDDLMTTRSTRAEDVAQDENVWEIVTAPTDLQAVREALEAEGVEIQNAELTMRPTTTVDLDEDATAKVLRLIEALDDQDDERRPRELRGRRRSARARRRGVVAWTANRAPASPPAASARTARCACRAAC